LFNGLRLNGQVDAVSRKRFRCVAVRRRMKMLADLTLAAGRRRLTRIRWRLIWAVLASRTGFDVVSLIHRGRERTRTGNTLPSKHAD
jgi:hypothetical protein